MDTIKRITPSFFDKAVFVSAPDIIQYSLENIEGIFKECNEELVAAGMSGCGYAFQEGAISEMTGNLETLVQYVETAHDHVSEELDNPLYVDFKNNAAESLSQIILDEITTDNTFGMEEHVQISGHGFTCVSKRVKADLKFSDFFGITDIEPEDGYLVLENVETMGEFASLFRADYDRMKPEGVSLDTFLKNYVSYGEYDHKAYHPVADFFSGLLDITIIKPIIECITGTDLITGERLTDEEKGMKMAGAVVDLFTLGQAMVLTKGAGLGAKVAGKVIAVELLSNAATYTVGYAGDAMGLPFPITWMLSVITGCTVSNVAGKYIYKDINGLEHELTEEEVERILKNEEDAYKQRNIEYEYEDEYEKFYENIFDSQREEFVEYEDYLEDLQRLQREGYPVPEGGLKTVDTGNLKVLETKTPELANSEWLANGYDKPPYHPDFEVKVVQAGKEEYVRVFSYNADGTSNKLGGWLMKKSDIEELTPAQIADKYALPKEPTHICDVKVNSDFNLQTGIANSVEGWGNGGGQQFDTMGKFIDEDAFINERLIGE